MQWKCRLISRIIIVLNCEVLEELGERDKLGSPESLEAKDSSAPVKAEENTKPQPNGISSNGFYGNKPQAQAQPQSKSLPTRGPSTNNNSSTYGNIYPIEALSPYAHKWTIKARCTNKGDIKTWHNKNGEGKLFSANFLDESGEIRATGFNDQCDALYELIQEGNVYYISSPCRVQLAKKQFSNVNNDYELTFERDTQVEKVCWAIQTLNTKTDTSRPKIKTMSHRYDTTSPMWETCSPWRKILRSTSSPFSRRSAKSLRSHQRRPANLTISAN